MRQLGHITDNEFIPSVWTQVRHVSRRPRHSARLSPAARRGTALVQTPPRDLNTHAKVMSCTSLISCNRPNHKTNKLAAFNKACSAGLKVLINNNKSAQSNLARRPHRGAVARVRPVDNGAPQILAQKYPFPWTDPQTPLPASSLNPFDQQSKWHTCRICRFSTVHWTDQPTHVHTDRQIVHGRV